MYKNNQDTFITEFVVLTSVWNGAATSDSV